VYFGKKQSPPCNPKKKPREKNVWERNGKTSMYSEIHGARHSACRVLLRVKKQKKPKSKGKKSCNKNSGETI
jgi:hypothetical protein